jgi:hypothetical protein
MGRSTSGSLQYQEHVGRLAGATDTPLPAPDAPQAPGEHPSGLAVRQFWILSALDLVWRDKDGLLLLIAPFLGVFDFIWKRDIFDPVTGKAEQTITMLFFLCLITVLVGTITSVREIVKEDAIYRRERMVCLQVLPYVGSKVAVGFLFAAYSAAVLFGFKLLTVDFSHLETADVLRLFVPVLLGTFSGLMWGLVVSALAPARTAPCCSSSSCWCPSSSSRAGCCLSAIWVRPARPLATSRRRGGSWAPWQLPQKSGVAPVTSRRLPS